MLLNILNDKKCVNDLKLSKVQNKHLKKQNMYYIYAGIHWQKTIKMACSALCVNTCSETFWHLVTELIDLLRLKMIPQVNETQPQNVESTLPCVIVPASLIDPGTIAFAESCVVHEVTRTFIAGW